VPDKARVTTSESVLDQHAEDFSRHRPHRPDAVVYPTSVAEVASVLSFASERLVRLVPFGAGTSLEGHIMPINRGITFDLTDEPDPRAEHGRPDCQGRGRLLAPATQTQNLLPVH